MANPQPTDAHLRIAHSINEQLMVSYFTEQQRRILDLILRLSWGCGKKEAIIPNQRDFELVGVGEGHIKAHLDWLIEAKVIERQDNQYAFNKNYDEWRVSRAFKFNQEKLTELVRLNLNGTYGKGELENKELTEKVRGNLRKREESSYGKGKFSTPELASSKERLNKILKKGILHIPNEGQTNFNVFWNAYPKKRNKGQAENAFEKVAPDEQLMTAMLTAIEQAKKSTQWLKDNGQFIPYPATWLNAKGWEDEYLEGGQSGTHRENSKPESSRNRHLGTKLPTKYTEPPYDPRLEAFAEAARRERENSPES